MWIIIGLLVTLVIQGCMRAAQITLVWDANPVEEQVTAYEVVAEEVFGLRKWQVWTPQTSATFTGLPAAPCYFRVRAANSTGWGNFCPNITGTPKPGMRLTLQAGDDLTGWTDAAPSVVRPMREREFYRVKMEVEP